ncbi:hypothetical protein [Cryobacterium breve]|uniref:hypothetical protein n=1 Tax=Cryobacterium breve TaxID=1259258 RepID=UPI00248AAA39|nr:hypothetical protein [Cryobacterium breve]
MREQGERGEDGVVQEPGVLAALGLELARVPFGEVGAADLGDALHDAGNALRDPPAGDRDREPAGEGEHDRHEGVIGEPRSTEHAREGRAEGGAQQDEPAPCGDEHQRDATDHRRGDARDHSLFAEVESRCSPADEADDEDHRHTADDDDRSPPQVPVAAEQVLGADYHEKKGKAQGERQPVGAARYQKGQERGDGTRKTGQLCALAQQPIPFLENALHTRSIAPRRAPQSTISGRGGFRHARGTQFRECALFTGHASGGIRLEGERRRHLGASRGNS